MTQEQAGSSAACPPCARGQHRENCACPCHKPVSSAATTLTRKPVTVLAVQCRKDNEAEVNAFLATTEAGGIYNRRWYRPNPHGAWQAIHDSKGMVEQVWVGNWLVAIPERQGYVAMNEARLRELHEVPTDE